MSTSEALLFAITALCMKSNQLIIDSSNAFEADYVRNCIERDEIEDAIEVLDHLYAKYKSAENDLQTEPLKNIIS